MNKPKALTQQQRFNQEARAERKQDRHADIESFFKAQGPLRAVNPGVRAMGPQPTSRKPTFRIRKKDPVAQLIALL